MGKIHLLVANANQNFDKNELNIFHNAVEKAKKFISSNFSFDYEVDLVITAPSFLLSVIPEDGISGRTYNSRLIVLAVDKSKIKINEGFVFETICHEMSHSLRWEKLPEYSKTMFDSMIFEGLAITLEEQAMTSSNFQNQQYFLSEMQNTSQEMIDSIMTHLKDKFGDEFYDYETVFFTGDDTLPRWSGYRLGYYFIQKQLAKNTSTIEELTTASYEIFSPQI